MPLLDGSATSVREAQPGTAGGTSTSIPLTELPRVNTLRHVKKLVVLMLAAAAVLCAVGAIVKLTLPSRAEAARARLTQVAQRFDQCYSRYASYEHCETGTRKLMVGERGKRRFTLVSAVEFGPTYMISGTPDGELERSCQPSSTHCPNGLWPSE
jgi:hypothetical protein